MLDEFFPNLYIPPCEGKICEFMVFTFLENALNLGIFTHGSVPHSKLQAKIFENLFPPTAERGGENYDCFIKIQSGNMKMTWNIKLVIFCMIFNFSKFDGFTVF